MSCPASLRPYARRHVRYWATAGLGGCYGMRGTEGGSGAATRGTLWTPPTPSSESHQVSPRTHAAVEER
eukprot:1655026-Rhodomonas_salina.1